MNSSNISVSHSAGPYPGTQLSKDFRKEGLRPRRRAAFSWSTEVVRCMSQTRGDTNFLEPVRHPSDVDPSPALESDLVTSFVGEKCRRVTQNTTR